MKKHKNLWDRFVGFENLYIAAKKAEQRKRYKSAAFEFNSEKEINLLSIRS